MAAMNSIAGVVNLPESAVHLGFADDLHHVSIKTGYVNESLGSVLFTQVQTGEIQEVAKLPRVIKEAILRDGYLFLSSLPVRYFASPLDPWEQGHIYQYMRIDLKEFSRRSVEARLPDRFAEFSQSAILDGSRILIPGEVGIADLIVFERSMVPGYPGGYYRMRLDLQKMEIRRSESVEGEWLGGSCDMKAVMEKVVNLFDHWMKE